MKAVVLVVIVLLSISFVSGAVITLKTTLEKEQLANELKTSPNLYLSLGNFLTRQGYFETAKDAFTASLKLDPDSEKAYHNLGVAYYKQGNLEKAKQAFENSIQLNDGYAKAYLSLAIVDYELGYKEDALAHLNKLFELEPQNYDAHFLIGVILTKEYWNSGDIVLLNSALVHFEIAEPFLDNAKINAEIIRNYLQK